MDNVELEKVLMLMKEYSVSSLRLDGLEVNMSHRAEELLEPKEINELKSSDDPINDIIGWTYDIGNKK